MDFPTTHQPIYRGETAERKALTGVVMTLLCPGLGLVYVGRTWAGLLVCMVYCAAIAGFVALWSHLSFFPVLPAGVLLLGLGLVSVLLALDVGAACRRLGKEYVLGSANHPLIYAAIALSFFYLPLSALAHFTLTRLWAFVWIDGDAMYPTLVDGDLILVDRDAFEEEQPVMGDLVVIRPLHPSLPLELGRVVGTPGVSVRIDGTWPAIDGVPLERRQVILDPLSPQAALAALEDVPAPPGSTTRAEGMDPVWYVISEQESSHFSTLGELRLTTDRYFVLHDNRGVAGDSRDQGPVELGRILGRPLFIAYSVADGGGVRWHRVARRLQGEGF